MSKYIRCEICDNKVKFEDTTYINDDPLCPECNAKVGYMLQPHVREE